MSSTAPSQRPERSAVGEVDTQHLGDATRQSAPARTGTLPRTLAGLVVGLAAVIVAALWLSLLPPRVMRLDVGNAASGDRIYIAGFYNPERASRDTASRNYRWASDGATLTLPTGQTGATILSAEFYAAPQPAGKPLDLTLHTGPTALAFVVPETERSYHLLIPPTAAANGVVRLRVAGVPVTPPGDDRKLTIAIDRVSLRPTDERAQPAVATLAIQLAVVGALALVLRLNRASTPVIAASAAAGALLLAALNLGARSWVVLGAWPLAGVGAALAALSLATRRLLPQADTAEARFARALWLITLVGLALRLVGTSAPGFVFHDLDVQALLFGRVLRGQIYLFENAHEFRGGMTFYPSGPYLLALPLLLIQPTLGFALHIGSAILDGLGVPLIALIARELGIGRRGALMAALLMATLPIQLTALWWGFFTNIGGQALLLLMLWLLLRHTRAPNRWTAALLFLGLSLALVSHVGVLTLTGTAAALTLALAWLPERPGAAAWRGLLGAGLLALAVFVLGYLSYVAAPMLGATAGVVKGQEALSPASVAESRAYIRGILPVAIWRGVGMLPFLLLLPGLPLIWASATRPLGRALTAAWALTPLIFVVVEYIYLVQVRYIYFLAPLCCLASGAVLERLWARRAGRPVAIAVLALIAWLGVFLWYNGAISGVKMSLVPLTH